MGFVGADFETWQQAESAIRAGCSVKQLVQREFERDFGPDCVQCVSIAVFPSLLCKLRSVWHAPMT